VDVDILANAINSPIEIPMFAAICPRRRHSTCRVQRACGRWLSSSWRALFL